jgi:hypothetical protein
MGGTCGTCEGEEMCVMFSVGKPEGNRLLRRPRRRRKYNIKTNLEARGWEDVDWIDLAQDRENLEYEHSVFTKCG